MDEATELPSRVASIIVCLCLSRRIEKSRNIFHVFGDNEISTSCCLNQVGYPNGNVKKNAVIGLKSVAIQANNSGSSFFGGQDTWFEEVPNTNRFAMMYLH